MGNKFLLPLRILQLITASAVLVLSSYGTPPYPPLRAGPARMTLRLARVLVWRNQKSSASPENRVGRHMDIKKTDET